jgi:hypothetical protein
MPVCSRPGRWIGPWRRNQIMKVFIFISDKEPSVRALTSDQMGGNLPAEYAPWSAINNGSGLLLASANDPIAVAIKVDGYSLVVS